MKFWSGTLSLIFMSAVFCASASSQVLQLDREDTQSWNDVQITAPVHKKVDVFAVGTLWFGKNLSRVEEGRFGGGVVVKLNKAVSVSPYYFYIESRNILGRFSTEHRLHLRGTYRFPFKKFGLSHRSLYEYRIRHRIRTWRYRPSLTFEKELPKKLLPNAKLFITEEPFYVAATRKFSRNRFSVGVAKTVNSKLQLDVYYLRQNDGISIPGDLHVIGTSWKVRL